MKARIIAIEAAWDKEVDPFVWGSAVIEHEGRIFTHSEGPFEPATMRAEILEAVTVLPDEHYLDADSIPKKEPAICLMWRSHNPLARRIFAEEFGVRSFMDYNWKVYASIREFRQYADALIESHLRRILEKQVHSQLSLIRQLHVLNTQNALTNALLAFLDKVDNAPPQAEPKAEPDIDREHAALKSMTKMSAMIACKAKHKGPLSSHTDARFNDSVKADFIIRDAMTQDILVIGFVAAPGETRSAQLNRLQPLLSFVKSTFDYIPVPDILVYSNLDLGLVESYIKMKELPKAYE